MRTDHLPVPPSPLGDPHAGDPRAGPRPSSVPKRDTMCIREHRGPQPGGRHRIREHPPVTASRPAASSWSASRSASIPHRPPASSCSMSSAPLRTSSDGCSPSVPATASPWRENAAGFRVGRRWIRRRFRRRTNSSRPVCRPQERPNSSISAGQQLTDSPPLCAKGPLRP